jgi:protease II
VPTRRGAWWYYGRTVEGSQYGIQCRAPLASADDWTPPELSPDVAVEGEQILLDGNIEAEGHEFFSLGSFEVTNDGDRMLYGVDVAGDERYTVRCATWSRRAAARRDPRHVRRRHLLARRPVHRLHDRRRRLAPRHRVAARARARPSPTT